ncbi:TPA: hypothetical protein O8L70_002883 [Enterobacter hormaechei]|nr:hypothetical protein [Enterobacter hormaechei]HEM8673207.1 hypothetical protein [Enterobacter hormaechei]
MMTFIQIPDYHLTVLMIFLKRGYMQVKIDFSPVEKELRACQRCFDRMNASSSYEEYEENWCDFLNRLEKSFEKLRRACAPAMGKFSSLISKENTMMGTDPLLQYLKQARNADTHSIQDIAKRIPAMYGIDFDYSQGGRSVFIKNMTIVGGTVTRYEGTHPLKMVFTPESIEVKEVENRKKVYHPPTSHLGKPLNTRHPAELARLGLDFYQKLLDKVKAGLA